MKEPLPDQNQERSSNNAPDPNEVERRLRAEAKDSVPAPSAFLHSRIVGALKRADREKVTTSNPPLFGHLIARVAALASLVIAVAYLATRNIQPELPPTTALNDQQLALTTSRVVELVEAIDGSRLHDVGVKLSAPLENELKLALNDAKTAVDFLSKSFLPSGFEAWPPADRSVENQ